MTGLLDWLEALRAQATPGPWDALEDFVSGDLDHPDGAWPVVTTEVTGARSEYERADLSLIAEVRNALPALLAVARAAERVVSADLALDEEMRLPQELGDAVDALDAALAVLGSEGRDE